MTTPTASDAQLIERLSRVAELRFKVFIEAIARLRELTQRPAEEQDGWVLLSTRKPTRDDSDPFGQVLYRGKNGAHVVDSWTAGLERTVSCFHWRRLPVPPAPAVLTPEEKIKAEDAAALEAECKRRYISEKNEEFRFGFLAGRQSLREGGS